MVAFRGTLWDMKLLDFVKLFVTPRQEFEFESTTHTTRSQGVDSDKANVKLDATDTYKPLSQVCPNLRQQDECCEEYSFMHGM
jgi:hypothetical protein